jgi:hypothetical protein
VLYESQGQVLFNEVHGETAEFRFFAEDILDGHVSQDISVTYQAKKVTQKSLGGADAVADLRKVFLVTQQDKIPNQFNNT